ncbi:hypothetical protein EVA_06167 [gut metagenome]|uniref:Uncharacterized protein n=1 Tax=gut metagenome TaxID=749906 RepID=J9GEG4_9ZZZZ
MSGGGQHVIHRRKTLRHKRSNFLEAVSADDELQIICTTHK